MHKIFVLLITSSSSILAYADRYGVSEVTEGGSGLSPFMWFLFVVFLIYLHFKDK